MRDQIRVHLQRVTKCPPAFPAGCYWYGDRCKGPRCPPKCIYDFVKDDAISMDSMENHNEDPPSEEDHHDQLEVHSEGQTNEEQLDMENQLVKEEQFDQRQDKSEDKQNKFRGTEQLKPKGQK